MNTNNIGTNCAPRKVFIERLWRGVKYEEVYLHECANGTEARTSLTRYFGF